ncbi:MAG: hypothetical protein ACSLFK_04845 [Gemmatimonadaceae bacterium]
MRHTMMMFITAGTIALPASAAAQRIESLSQGEKIRVSTGVNARTVGFLDSLTDQTLSMRVVGRDHRSSQFSVGRPEVTRLEVRRTNRIKGALKGAAIGLGAGFLSGFALGVVLHENEDSCFMFCSAVETGFLLGAVGGVIATPVGLIGGASQGAGTWKRIDPATAKLK